MDIICDYVAAVVAPLEVRMERIIKRDGITEENAKIRMKAQNPQEFYTVPADCVINGAGSLEEIQKEVDSLFNRLCRG